MSRESLIVRELSIHRAPGFERGGFAIPELSGGINLIHGPNGVGKSTTARAVAGLLWPSLTDGQRVSLTGRGQLAGEPWAVDVEGGRVDWQMNGSGGSPPRLPAPEAHRRYRLALHDLLQEDDTDFAAAIIRESAGGYDVRGLGEVLNPGLPHSRRHSAKQDAVVRARTAYDEAVAQQRALQERERELTARRRDLERADDARRRSAMLEAALEHARAREAEAEARRELAHFEAGMARVNGEEYERLCRLRDQVRSIEKDRERHEADRLAAEQELQTLALPPEALEEGLLDGLDADLERLQRLDHEVSRLRTEHARAAEALQQLSERLASMGDTDRLAAVDLEGIGDLSELIRRTEQLSGRRAGIDEQLHLNPEPASAGNPDQLKEGVRLLRCWLRTPPPAPARQTDSHAVTAGVAAAVILMVLGVLLAVTGSPLYLVVAAIGAGLLWTMRQRRAAPQPEVDERAMHRRDYERLRLDAPTEWETEAVIIRLERLVAEGDAAREAEETGKRRARLLSQRRELEEEERELAAQCAAIADQLGIGVVEPRSLGWLVDTIGAWQRQHDAALGEAAALRDMEAQMHELTEALRRRLEPLGFNDVGTIGALRGAVRVFRQRRDAHQSAARAAQEAAAALERLAGDRAEREGEIAELFQRLELEPDQDETVKAWCEGRSDYQKAYQAQRGAESVLAAARNRLAGWDAADELADLPGPELQLMIADEAEVAGQRDEIAREINVTVDRIEQAKRSHDVEAALAAVQRAEDALRDALEEDARAAIAYELIEAIEGATRDQHLPAVFQRARELFSRITHGQYELRMGTENAEFSAYDTVAGRLRRLDELSSGTRVQLLLAVRVAFVEQQEDGVMLPVLLDEVLGNSDDERARAIMEAVVELAREGRQILYFTAQGDEVARWRGLEAAGGLDGVGLREIDLARVRGAEGRLEIPEMVSPARRQPPEPNGSDHAEYGRRLGVPRLDRVGDSAGAIHLWYLVDEPQSLYRMLDLGVERWGPLQSLLRDGGRVLLAAEERERLEARGRALEAFLEAAQVGVGRPVDRIALEDSGAVTDRFIDEVSELAGDLGGNAAALIESLEARQVPGFRKNSVVALQEYLEDNGHLPAEEPLGLDQIRLRVLSRIAPDLDAGRLTSRDLNDLLGRLWLGISGPGGGGEADGDSAAFGGEVAGDQDGGSAGDLDGRL